MKELSVSSSPVTIEEAVSAEESGVLHLQLPHEALYKSVNAHYNGSRYTKEWLESYFGAYLRAIRSGKIEIVVHGDEWALERFGPYFKKLINGDRSAVKDVFLTFAVVISSSQINMLGICDFYTTPLCRRKMKDEVEAGGLPLDPIVEEFKISVSYCFWRSRDKYQDLLKSENTMMLLRFSDVVSSYDYETPSKSKYRVKTDFLLPQGRMISYVLGKKYGGSPKISWRAALPQSPSSPWHVAGEDIMKAAMDLRGMLATGALSNGRTKLPLNAVKRVRNFLKFPNLPAFADTDYTDTVGLLSLLSVLSDYKVMKPADGNDRFLGLLYDVMKECPEQLIAVWLSKSVSKPSPSFLTEWREGVRMLACHVLIILSRLITQDSGWAEWDSFNDCVLFSLSSMDYGYLVPRDYYGSLERVTDLSGRELSLPETKRLIHDTLVHEIVLTFAALGGLEIKTEEDGPGRWIRLTPLGKWYLDRNLDFPVEHLQKSEDDAFEVDDSLKIVQVKNPDTPYIHLLKECAKKITSSRYIFTESSMLSGCATKASLRERINMLKSNVIGVSGPVMSEFFKSLEKRFNKVVPTPGGTTYRLFDIVDGDKNVRDLILSDPDIMQYSLRVEGSRLLIKESHVDSFFMKLRAAGYPCDRR